MINATNFEFNGISANDLGLYIVSFDDANDGEQDHGGAIMYNTSHGSQSNRWNIHGSYYEDVLTFSFQVMKSKDKCYTEPVEISVREQAYIQRWLERSDGYKWLRFINTPDKPASDFCYHCTLKVKWYKINSQVYGATITVTADSPYAYSPIQSISGYLEVPSVNGYKPLYIYNDSDMIGAIDFIQIEIVPKDSGNMQIKNTLQQMYSANDVTMNIENCIAGEQIIINGYTKMPQTSSQHQLTIMEDYNFKPIRLVNYDNQLFEERDLYSQNRLNSIENVGDIALDISFTYRTIRQGVI